MSSLEFTVVSASLLAGVGEMQQGTPSISYRTKLGAGERLKLTTGETAAEVESIVNFVAIESNSPEAGSAGYMRYFPAVNDVEIQRRARSYAVVFAPLALVQELLAAARIGRLPTSIYVEATGLYFDGLGASATLWDTKANPKIPITSANATLPIAVAGEELEDEPQIEQTLPPTRAQLAELVAILRELRLSTVRGFRIVTVVIAIIVIFLLFAR